MEKKTQKRNEDSSNFEQKRSRNAEWACIYIYYPAFLTQTQNNNDRKMKKRKKRTQD